MNWSEFPERFTGAILSSYDWSEEPGQVTTVQPQRYYQGKRCDDLFCILDGQIKLARVNREGRELTTALMTIGEFFGPALGAQDVRQTLETATAKGSVAVWRVAAKEFHQLLLNQRVLGLRMVEALTRRQRQMERRLECFVFKRAEARLAETLRELSGVVAK